MKKINQITAFLLGMLSIAALHSKAQKRSLLVDPMKNSRSINSYWPSAEYTISN